MEIAKVCVRDASKERDYVLPEGCEVVTDYDSILGDESIDMVVEVMGGTTEAKDIVYASLRAGKDVVTANKALIAAFLPEIDKIVTETNAKRVGLPPVEFRYEAAVCGGIPIIRSLLSDFVGDDVKEISGIINGCTNFMLTSMDKNGWSYDDALAKAAELGYAEADPTLDVGGFDARSKLRILMPLRSVWMWKRTRYLVRESPSSPRSTSSTPGCLVARSSSLALPGPLGKEAMARNRLLHLSRPLTSRTTTRLPTLTSLLTPSR